MYAMFHLYFQHGKKSLFFILQFELCFMYVNCFEAILPFYIYCI